MFKINALSIYLTSAIFLRRRKQDTTRRSSNTKKKLVIQLIEYFKKENQRIESQNNHAVSYCKWIVALFFCIF